MLRDKILTFDEAIEDIGIAKRNGWTLADAMIVMGCPAPYQTKGTRLGELLIASEVLAIDDITATLNAASASGLPLGRVLLLLDRLPEGVLDSALQLQHDLRLGKMEGPRSSPGAPPRQNKSAKHPPYRARDWRVARFRRSAQNCRS